MSTAGLTRPFLSVQTFGVNGAAQRDAIGVGQGEQRGLHVVVESDHVDENRVAVVGGRPHFAGHEAPAVLPGANLRLAI